MRKFPPYPLFRRLHAKPFSGGDGGGASLTAGELSEIHRLVPLLCTSNHHDVAIRLISTALLTSPPLSSLPLPSLISHLAAHPSLSPAFALLTALRHHPRRPSPLPFAALLLSSFFSSRRPKDAAKVFAWLLREDVPFRPDEEVYEIAILGFCKHGMMAEAVRAVREMVRDRVEVGGEGKKMVCSGLLQEARVEAAQELERVIGSGGEEAAEVLDRIVREWED